MRFLYAGIGVIGGVLSIAIAYLFLTFVMFMGGGSGALAKVVLYVILAFVLAALLNLVAGFMDPRKAAPLRLLLASASIWVLGALFLGGVSYADRGGDVGLLNTLKFIALIAAPALLPLAAWAFARWRFLQA